MALATEEEREALIRENPAFANVICRCELVTEERSGSHSPSGGSDDIRMVSNAAPEPEWADARQASVPRRRWKSCRENCISIRHRSLRKEPAQRF